MRDDENAGFYDLDSSTYDQTRWQSRAGVFNNETQQRIVGVLTSSWKNEDVLEVGPGTGRFTLPLARKGNRMTLVDASSGMLEVARRKLEQEGYEHAIARAIHASIYDLPIAEKTFGYALCLNIFSHLDDIQRAIQELARVLKPNGLLLVNYPNLQSYYWPVARRINAQARAIDEDVFSIWTRPKEMSRWLRRAGFEVLRRRGHVHVPRALEKYPVLSAVRALDAISRRSPFERLAPMQFRLCRRLP